MLKTGRVATIASLFLFLASSAVADTVRSSPALTLSSKQTWALVIGALIPLVTYVLNHVGPWVTEPAKAFVTVLVSGIAGGLYTALATTSFGWNSSTVQMVATSVLATLAAHHMLWKPAGISTMLGGGTNSARRRLAWVTEPAAPDDPPGPTLTSS